MVDHYGEELENTIVQLRIDTAAKREINFLKHRNAMIKEELENSAEDLTPEAKEDYLLQLQEIPLQIKRLEKLKKSVSKFVTTFYN